VDNNHNSFHPVLVYFWVCIPHQANADQCRPIYARRVNRFFSQKGKIDYEDIYEANPGEDYIQENQRYDRRQRLIRMIISYLITFFVFGMSAGLSVVFVVLEESTGGYM
jgi:hypothetical protein